MYQVTKELHKFITYEFSKEDIQNLINNHGFEHWDINNMTKENFEELIYDVEGDYLENCCEVEVETLSDSVTNIVLLEEPKKTFLDKIKVFFKDFFKSIYGY